jgi:hypothetical protein
VAQRLGSPLDAVLRLLNGEGQEIARVDDAAGAGGDCRLEHLFESEGDYFVALRDVRHAGGTAHRYRLRVGSFPLVTAVYPAGGRSGAIMSFELAGREGDAASMVNVELPKAHGAARLASFSVPSTEDGGSGWFQVEANPGNESLEHEPNEGFTQATPVQFPGVVNGRLDKPGDRDDFKFQAQKGQRVHGVARTRELGSPCDLHVSLHTADGNQIAQARQELQTILDAEIPADGEYTLHVEDLLVGASGSGCVYRVEVDDAFAGFTLNAEQPQYTAPQGGTLVVKVLAQRQGYDGSIELGVEGLGDGVTLEGQTFEGPETLLKITLPADISAGELRQAAIIGKAKVGEKVLTARANQRTPLKALFPNVLAFPTALENAIAVGVGPAFPPFFELSPASSPVYFPQLVGASTFDVNIARKNEAFKEAISLAVEGLPPGVTAEVAPVDDGLKAVRVSLKGPVELAEGDFPLRLVGTGKFQEQTQVVRLENLTLRVVKPLVVSVNLSAPITAGSAQKATVAVQRFGEEPQPVRLQFSDGPAGLSAPIVVMIPADKNSTEISFTAAADAPAGKYENLAAVASTTVKGQNVTVTSPPVSVEILPSSGEKSSEGKP